MFLISLPGGSKTFLSFKGRAALPQTPIDMGSRWAQLSSFHHVFACTHRGKLQGRSCLGNRKTKVFGKDWDHLQHSTCVNNSNEMFLVPFLPFSSDVNCHLFPGKTDFNSSVPFVQKGHMMIQLGHTKKQINCQISDAWAQSKRMSFFRGMLFFKIMSAGLFPFLGKEKLICWGWMITLQPQWGSRKSLLRPAFNLQPRLCRAAWGHAVWQISALVQSLTAPQGCFYRA